MGAQWSQFFPGKPTFTEESLAPQDGKVYLITGGSSGIGYEMVKMLYAKNARVYIAGRAEDKARKAIQDLRASVLSTGGSIEYLHLELDNLASMKSSVEEFKAKESKLHVLWNNAGISQPPLGSVSKQGVELQLATNCLGPFLFTQLLLPLLQAAASESQTPGSVRVVWTTSQVIELSAPEGGIIMSELSDPPNDKTRNYINSKTGNLFLSTELARRVGPSQGIVSVAQNPGAASTNLFRHTPWISYLAWPLLHDPKFAAYTQLYAGLSKDIGVGNNGCYIVPWGRITTGLREDLVVATRLEGDGGSGRAKEFWEFCEEKTRAYS
ncbi:hypothetical protein VP1G_03511 [Cytospora mali]|uniref:Oxidoreductase n=1 Tax=Cytospora mali TaxID=578113 RepID=A0A194UX54_CYTMA|nr:hypothetical protein VP1G_03511 [Valsa mali var. pyri (nom. inval.)]